jgi:hypothetical protein
MAEIKQETPEWQELPCMQKFVKELIRAYNNPRSLQSKNRLSAIIEIFSGQILDSGLLNHKALAAEMSKRGEKIEYYQLPSLFLGYGIRTPTLAQIIYETLGRIARVENKKITNPDEINARRLREELQGIGITGIRQLLQIIGITNLRKSFKIPTKVGRRFDPSSLSAMVRREIWGQLEKEGCVSSTKLVAALVGSGVEKEKARNAVQNEIQRLVKVGLVFPLIKEPSNRPARNRPTERAPVK